MNKILLFMIIFGQIILAQNNSNKSPKLNAANLNVNQTQNLNQKANESAKAPEITKQTESLKSSEPIKNTDSLKKPDEVKTIAQTGTQETNLKNDKTEPLRDLNKDNPSKVTSNLDQKNEDSQLPPLEKNIESSSKDANLAIEPAKKSMTIKTDKPEENSASKNDYVNSQTISSEKNLDHHFRQIINGFKTLKKINAQNLPVNEKQNLTEHLIDNLIATLDLIKTDLQKIESFNKDDFQNIKSMLYEKPFNLKNIKQLNQKMKKLISPNVTSNEIIHELVDIDKS
jgi:hypothetical protein